MIATVVEVKAALGITSADYDDYISALIPAISEQIFDYCNNWFLDDRVYTRNSDFVFSNSARTIASAASDFVTDGFLTGMEVKVIDSLLNDRNYTLLTVATNLLTLIADEVLTDEDSGETICIEFMQVPKPIKEALYKLIGASIGVKDGQINEDKSVKSEKVGSVSVGYAGSDSGGSDSGSFPIEVQRILNVYRRPKFVKAYK